MKKQKAAQNSATAAKSNIYQVVTDRILTSLREGLIPWEKPWQAPSFAGGHSPATCAPASLTAA
ncbi:MAG: ArdC-like ssDNA-binding domain-containing protein [Janthinobacterium lividum]